MDIVVNADDYGLTDGVCQATLELLERGAVSNTSVMVAAVDAWERIAHFGVRRIRGVAGVHLQVSDGVPLTAAERASTLFDPATGRFLPFATIAESADPAEVQLEWRAQIEAFATHTGFTPTHLDSHQAIHRQPRFVDVFLELAAEYRLPIRGGERFIVRRMREQGVSGSTALVRAWTGKRLPVAVLEAEIDDVAARAGADGLIEVVTHPAHSAPELAAFDRPGFDRDHDYVGLMELADSDWLASHGYARVAR